MSRLLTVGLPIYNSMPYLPEAVQGLLSQTVSDFDILAIVDDCSDGSVEYMESLRDPRLRIIRQPKAGLASALNLMLRETQTPWLVRQDTDDVSYPTRLERLAHWISKAPEAGMFYSLAEYYPRDRSVGQFRCTKGSAEELRAIVQSGYLLSFCHPSVMLNVQKTLAIGGYTVGLHVEDMDLWWRMALAYDIQFIPELLIGYRQNSSSLTTHNMLRAHVEGLYDQYLLLSHLHGLQPRALVDVKYLLEGFTSKRDLEAKEKLRSFNMLLSDKKYFAAGLAAAASFFTSPSYLFTRLRDEFSSSRRITNGVNPERFLRKKAEFW